MAKPKATYIEVYRCPNCGHKLLVCDIKGGATTFCTFCKNYIRITFEVLGKEYERANINVENIDDYREKNM